MLDSSSKILGETSELAGGISLSLSLVRCSPSGPLSAFVSAPPPLGMRGGIYSVNMPPLKASNEDSESIIFP